MRMIDAYRVLGVLPTADDAVIRAAYLALMKRYHPDTPQADVERAKSVAAAYQLLSNPDRRAAHDRALAEQELELPAGGGAAAARRPARQTGRLAFFFISAATAGLLYVALTQPVPVFESESRPAEIARAAEASLGRAEVPLSPEPRVESPPPQEESQVAATLRPPVETEAALPDVRDIPLPIPTPAPVDLPKPLAREATTRRAEPTRTAPVRVAASEAPAKAAEPAAERRSGIDLKALDRHQVIYYNQSYLAADAPRRAKLMATRLTFLKQLGECGSDACRRDAYLARNQELAAIMRR